MNQLIGFLLTVLTLVLAIILIVPVDIFFQPYALLLVIGCVLGVTFMSYGSHSFAIFKYASQPLKNQKEYFWVISFFDNLSNTAIISGTLGTMISHIMSVSKVSSIPELLDLSGSNTLPILYGYVLAKLIFEPLKQNVLRKAVVVNINENVHKQIAKNNEIANRLNILAIAIIIVSGILIII